MITFYGRSYEPCHISPPKTDVIDKYHISSIIVNNLIWLVRKDVLETADSFISIMMGNYIFLYTENDLQW